MYYPVVLKIADRSVVVIGGGEVAEAKVQSLLESRAQVTVISPELTPVLHGLACANAINWIDREYVASDIEGAFLVIAATDVASVQERIWRDANEHRVLVNTVDKPEHCDFIMPSVVRRGDLIVAVSTSGQSPAFAAWLQRKLSDWLTADFGRVVTLLGSFRGEVRTRFKTVSERKRVFQRIIDSEIVTWIRDCDDNSARARVRTIIEKL